MALYELLEYEYVVDLLLTAEIAYRFQQQWKSCHLAF